MYSPFASVFFFATGDAEEIPDAEVGGTLVLEAGREAVFESPVYILGSSGQLLLLVSFLLKNPDFLSRNPDFLLENDEFIIFKKNTTQRRESCSEPPNYLIRAIFLLKRLIFLFKRLIFLLKRLSFLLQRLIFPFK